MLWPEWFSGGHFDKFRRLSRTWNSLFQQRPAPDEGTYFKRNWFQRYDLGQNPPVRKYGASDYAVSDDEGDYTEHGVFGFDNSDDIWILDWWYGQKSSDVWIESQIDLVRDHRPFAWFGESGVIKKAIEPFLLKSMTRRKTYVRLEWLPSIHDKPTRARGIQGIAAAGKIHIPRCPWGDRLLNQLTQFPAGANDDAVDVLSLIGRAVESGEGMLDPSDVDSCAG
jgi:predicted phage terminase large subunit-like protein